MFPNWNLLKLVSYPQRLGDRGAIFFLFYFKEMVIRSLGKTFLSFKTGKRPREDLHLKGAKKELIIANFPK